MRTFNYLTLILSFTLLFASCKKDEDATENRTPTPKEQEYTVDILVTYTGNYGTGTIIKYNDKDGVRQQENLDLNQTEWKKTMVVKTGYTVFARGEFNLLPGNQHSFDLKVNINKKDGSYVDSYSSPHKTTNLTKAVTLPKKYTKTL